MTRRVQRLAVLLLFLAATATFGEVGFVFAESQKPTYTWDGWHKVADPARLQYRVFHDRVVALSNLSKGCDPGVAFSFWGKVAKVNFDSQGWVIENFVLETNDGERSLINVDKISLDDPGMNRADLSWIAQGLQGLLRPNGYIQGSALACGASGRVVTLDKISSSSAKPFSNLHTPMPSLPATALVNPHNSLHKPEATTSKVSLF